jgi:hypothetical protein
MSCLMNTRNTHTHTNTHSRRSLSICHSIAVPLNRTTHATLTNKKAFQWQRRERVLDGSKTRTFSHDVGCKHAFHRRTHLNPLYGHAQHHPTRSLACSHLSASGKQNIDVKTIRPLDHEAEKNILKQVRNGRLSSTPSLNQRSIPLFRAALPLRSHIIAHSSVHSQVFVWNTTLSS